MNINLPNLVSNLQLNTAQFQAELAAARAALRNAGETGKRELGGLALGLTKIATGLPAIAAATAALGGLAAGAVAAGLAAGAFGAAIKPQFAEVTKAIDAAKASEEAHEVAVKKTAAAKSLAKKGGDEYKKALAEAKSATEDAATAEAAYQAQLAGMPPATRDTAVALRGLKDDYTAWSKSLAGDTMPVATKGIQFMRDLLPSLTPLVRAAAGAFSQMFDKLSAGIKGAGFKQWMADMTAAAGPALTNFITVIGNLGRGFGGLLQAFLPVSGGVTGGLVKMTDAFADWGQSLKHSEGFARFLESARNGAGMLGNLGSALVALLVALAPLFNTTALLADAFARLIVAIPTPVLTAIAAVITTIGVAMKLWAIYSALAATATSVWAAAVAVFNVIMAANPIVLVTLAIIALVAAIVIAYRESETFRAIVQEVWAWVQAAISAAVEAIKSSINWFAGLPGLFGGWFGSAKDAVVSRLAEMILWVSGLPGRASDALSGLGSAVAGRAREGFQSMQDAAAAKVTGLLFWTLGIPGRIVGALGDTGRLLYNAGASIVQGLIDGLRSKAQAMVDSVSGILSKARGLFPSSPAKEGPFSGRGWTTYSGEAIMTGLAAGMRAGAPAVRAAASAALAGAQGAMSGLNVAAAVPSASSITSAYAGSAAPSRTIAPVINLYGSDATAGGMSRELAWYGRVG
ncbi:hypothetical protein ACIBSV_12085 [Embleya sp. NPDC050154]|uniref:hypothetical protein n=1 Tax=Embleya sp. NPDC050154 TaxID=3363988 RepID=UPI00378F2B77